MELAYLSKTVLRLFSWLGNASFCDKGIFPVKGRGLIIGSSMSSTEPMEYEVLHREPVALVYKMFKI